LHAPEWDAQFQPAIELETCVQTIMIHLEELMNEKEMLQIVERFSRKSEPAEGEIKVTQVPDYKTVHIEQLDGIGRSILLSEYVVDGMTYWAGFSPYSATVFVSRASRT